MSQLSLFTRRPAARLRGAREIDIHCGIVQVLRRWKKPGWRFIHPASGELRSHAAAVKLHRMGVEPGWPDLQLLGPKPPHIFFMEIKSQGGRLTVEQRAFEAFCKEIDIPHEVVRSVDEGLAVLAGWGVLKVKVEVAA
jgi:hypothetical protein